MKASVRGQRVIITGAASGIGEEIARQFLAEGARVHICDNSKETLERCVRDLPGLGATLADASDPAQVDRLFEEAAAALGGLDVLVNNVGIAGPTGEIDQIDPADWERTLAVNLHSHFYCCRRAAPLLKAADGGSIVNIASTAGLMGYPLRSPYAASKWAVIGLTKTLAMELGQYGIRVNAICPGSVEGPRMDRVIRAEAAAFGVSPESVRWGYERQSSLGTFISRADIAQLIIFMCSPLGAKISGQALAVDGHTETLRSV